MTENWRVKTARFFGLTFLPSLPFFGLRRGRGLRLGRRDPRDEDLLAAQRRDGGVHRVGDALAADGLAAARASRVCKCRHGCSLVAVSVEGSALALAPDRSAYAHRTGGRGMPGRGRGRRPHDADAAVDHLLQLVLQRRRGQRRLERDLPLHVQASPATGWPSASRASPGPACIDA